MSGNLGALDDAANGTLAAGDDGAGASSVTLALPGESAIGTSHGTAVYDGNGNDRSAGVSWTHTGWRFSRAASRKVLKYLVTGTTAAIGGVVCFAFTEVPAIVFGCGAIVAKIADEIGKAVAKSALARPKDCLEAGAVFFPAHPYAKITRC